MASRGYNIYLYSGLSSIQDAKQYENHLNHLELLNQFKIKRSVLIGYIRWVVKHTTMIMTKMKVKGHEKEKERKIPLINSFGEVRVELKRASIEK